MPGPGTYDDYFANLFEWGGLKFFDFEFRRLLKWYFPRGCIFIISSWTPGPGTILWVDSFWGNTR